MEFGMKELYDVVLKTNQPLYIENRKLEENETIAVFDKILISTIEEQKSRHTAHGSYDDRNFVFWEDTKQANFALSQGIFSKTQFALMSNSKLIEINQQEPLYINKIEKVESQENSVAILSKPVSDKYFCYDAATGKRIIPLKLGERQFDVGKPYREVIFHYSYEYKNNATEMIVGRQLIQGFLSLEGKTKIKDDITGKVKTAIIKMPKLKLMNDLKMILGENAQPLVGTLYATAFPIGERATKKVMEIIYLNDDIDCDIE